MTDKDYFELRNKLKESAESLSRAKGKEYANEYAEEFDRLHNFKAIGNLIGVTPETTALVYLAKPILSLASTVKRIEAGERLTDIDGDLTESVKSRIEDIDNYNSLLWALLMERKNTELKNSSHKSLEIKGGTEDD